MLCQTGFLCPYFQVLKSINIRFFFLYLINHYVDFIAYLCTRKHTVA